jgi:hypothetical protein
MALSNNKHEGLDMICIRKETVIMYDTTQYQPRLLWAVAGISWGAISYAYVASVISTTLGTLFIVQSMICDQRLVLTEYVKASHHF